MQEEREWWRWLNVPDRVLATESHRSAFQEQGAVRQGLGAAPVADSGAPRLKRLAEARQPRHRQGLVRPHLCRGPRELGSVYELGSGRAFDAEDFTIREYQRFEGVSDPDDSSIVYAIETRSGTKGLLVDAFGPYANPEVGRLLETVEIHGGAS